MSKITKKQLQRDIYNLATELTNLKIELSENNVIDINSKPQLKQLDQSDDIAKELAEVDLTGSELTGSELVRAMFERGDNYIMCVVGTIREVVIIDTFQDGYFYSKGVRYLNPKPINNQGEPLTAAEAGL